MSFCTLHLRFSATIILESDVIMLKKMFKKTRLKPFLLSIFVSIIILVAIMTSISAVGFVVAKDNMQDMISTTLKADNAVKLSRIKANVAVRYLQQMLITDDPSTLSSSEEKVHESLATISEQIAIIRESYTGKDDLVNQYEQILGVWGTAAQKAMSEISSGDLKAARNTILKEANPALDTLIDVATRLSASADQQVQNSQAYNRKLLNFFLFATIILFVIVATISVIYGLGTTKCIVSATDMARDAVAGLAKGDLSTRMDYDGKNEFAELAQGMNFSFDELSKYVNAIKYGMNQFAAGNLNCSCPIEFIGDFAAIKNDINFFRNKMSQALSGLATGSEQVNGGASQVSDSAQSLAQGATEQASSSEELAASIADISSQLQTTASHAQKANMLGKDAGEAVSVSKREISQLIDAITDISKKATDIQHIVKTIDDIAFQTNILALNAAVEAARAGSAGKGFAVVADEVRNLANKSAEAAKHTTELIDSSLVSVQNGTRLAQQTGAAFGEVEHYAAEILGTLSQITEAIESQATSVSQINIGVEQISAVIQQNSAASEQCAAASEELNSQSNVMRSLIEQFQLDESACS